MTRWKQLKLFTAATLSRTSRVNIDDDDNSKFSQMDPETLSCESLSAEASFARPVEFLWEQRDEGVAWEFSSDTKRKLLQACKQWQVQQNNWRTIFPNTFFRTGWFCGGLLLQNWGSGIDSEKGLKLYHSQFWMCFRKSLGQFRF